MLKKLFLLIVALQLTITSLHAITKEEAIKHSEVLLDILKSQGITCKLVNDWEPFAGGGSEEPDITIAYLNGATLKAKTKEGIIINLETLQLKLNDLGMPSTPAGKHLIALFYSSGPNPRFNALITGPLYRAHVFDLQKENKYDAIVTHVQRLITPVAPEAKKHLLKRPPVKYTPEDYPVGEGEGDEDEDNSRYAKKGGPYRGAGSGAPTAPIDTRHVGVKTEHTLAANDVIFLDDDLEETERPALPAPIAAKAEPSKPPIAASASASAGTIRLKSMSFHDFAKALKNKLSASIFTAGKTGFIWFLNSYICTSVLIHPIDFLNTCPIQSEKFYIFIFTASIEKEDDFLSSYLSKIAIPRDVFFLNTEKFNIGHLFSHFLNHIGESYTEAAKDPRNPALEEIKKSIHTLTLLIHNGIIHPEPYYKVILKPSTADGHLDKGALPGADGKAFAAGVPNTAPGIRANVALVTAVARVAGPLPLEPVPAPASHQKPSTSASAQKLSLVPTDHGKSLGVAAPPCLGGGESGATAAGTRRARLEQKATDPHSLWVTKDARVQYLRWEPTTHLDETSKILDGKKLTLMVTYARDWQTISETDIREKVKSLRSNNIFHQKQCFILLVNDLNPDETIEDNSRLYKYLQEEETLLKIKIQNEVGGKAQGGAYAVFNRWRENLMPH